VDEPAVIQLLTRSFSEGDWQYLKQHPGFQKLIKEHNGSCEDFEYLVEVGQLLLRQKQDLNLE
jgi:hypothetical protein